MPKATRATARKKGQPRLDGAMDVNIPNGKPGNSKMDRDWIEANHDLLVPIEDDDGVPFGARQKWTGKLEDIGSEWQFPPHDGRCVGTSFIRDEEGRRICGPDMELLTRPCYRWPIKGSRVCVKHGGSMEDIRNAALRRMVAAADAATGRLIMLALDTRTPAKEQIMALNSLLDRAGLKGGQDITVVMPEWQSMLREMFEGSPAAGREATHTVGVTKPRKTAAKKAAPRKATARGD